MKLLRCHIENFGVLSNFDYTFSDGLNVICRENGFGKSTLAAFLKAMFYGLPRTGTRSLAGNDRKRYEPWQGGVFGGFLEFTYKDISYRVTRTFGKTAAKDTFELLDLTNRTAKTPFTERLGEELFQLDADSFARSTYLPQLGPREMEATTSIRAKLGNLVDDTNDMNNFDTAEAALRAYRSRRKAYRGASGEIDQLTQQYHALEAQKFAAEEKKPQLEAAMREIERLNAEKETKTGEIAALREQIRASARQKERKLRQEQLEQIKSELSRQEEMLASLDKTYPAGLPTAEEIKEQRKNLLSFGQAEHQLHALTLSQEDREIAARGKALFSDGQKTEQDLQAAEAACRELTLLEGKLSAQLLKEEESRLRALTQTFSNGTPDEESLQEGFLASDRMQAAQLRLADCNMQPESQERLDTLRRMFRAGEPDDETLSDWQARAQENAVLEKRKQDCALRPEEQRELDGYRREFSSGIPEEAEIQKRQKDCRRVAELSGRKSATTLRIEEEQKAGKPEGKALWLLLGAGLALWAAGGFFFAKRLLTPGIVCMVLGALGLISFVFLRGKENRAAKTSVIRTSAISDEENQELYDLQRSCGDFLLRFFEDASNPEEKLTQLLLDRSACLRLQEKKDACRREQEALDEKIEENERVLRAGFAQYYPGEDYREVFLREVAAARQEYRTLSKQAAQVTEERAQLAETVQTCRGKLLQLLRPYYPAEMPDDLRGALRQLAADCTAYRELSHKKEQMQRQNAENRARAEKLTQQIRAMLASYQALDENRTLAESLQAMRQALHAYQASSERVMRYEADAAAANEQKTSAEKSMELFRKTYQISENLTDYSLETLENDRRAQEDARKRRIETRKKLEEFLDENKDLTQQIPQEPSLPAPEVLQDAEQNAQRALDKMQTQLRELRQQRESLRSQTEQIPAWDDQMAQLRQALARAQKQCEIADQTIEFLNRAKDHLANSYTGAVEQGFTQYAKKLLDGKLGHVMIDKDLRLLIDEKGAARQTASFSAGTMDGVMLCMRLALVDALFENEQPFLLLDDPFVNLDDERTKRALELLQQIAKERQVVYLVCNSARA